MFHAHAGLVAFAAAIAVSGGLSTPASGAYTLTIIARTWGGPPLDFDYVTSAPVINSTGKVAFHGVTNDSTNPIGGGMYVGDGGTPVAVVTTPQQYWAMDIFPGINDSGAVMFCATTSESDIMGVYIKSSGGTTTIVDGDPDISSGFPSPSLNNLGQVAFRTYSTSGQVIKRGSGSALTTIADCDGQFDGLGFPVIDNSGSVLFAGYQTLPYHAGLYLSNSSGNASMVVDGSTASSVFPTYDLANDGTVAFTTYDGNWVHRVMRGSNIIADSTGLYDSFPLVCISPSGQRVAFNAVVDDLRTGIFIGPNPVQDKVFITGDLLEGVPVNYIADISSQAINDAGQVTFYATREDGRGYIVRADPISQAIPGDVTGNGAVNLDDLLAVINAWGVCPNPNNCPADVTHNGVVNIDDLLVVINHWS